MSKYTSFELKKSHSFEKEQPLGSFRGETFYGIINKKTAFTH